MLKNKILLLSEAETKEYCDCFYNGRLNSMRDCYKEAIKAWKKEKPIDVLNLFKKQVEIIEKLIRDENNGK